MQQRRQSKSSVRPPRSSHLKSLNSSFRRSKVYDIYRKIAISNLQLSHSMDLKSFQSRSIDFNRNETRSSGKTLSARFHRSRSSAYRKYSVLIFRSYPPNCVDRDDRISPGLFRYKGSRCNKDSFLPNPIPPISPDLLPSALTNSEPLKRTLRSRCFQSAVFSYVVFMFFMLSRPSGKFVFRTRDCCSSCCRIALPERSTLGSPSRDAINSVFIIAVNEPTL